MSGLMEWEKADNPLHVLSLGAGRQSSVMYLMAIAGEIQPAPDYAVFADTGNEPQHVYQQLWYLAECNETAAFPVPIHIVTAGDIYTDSIEAVTTGKTDNWGVNRWEGAPLFSEGGGPIKRKCTAYYKIRPQRQFFRRAMSVAGHKKIVNWRGHTTSEIHRAKPDKRQYVAIRWPLLEARMSDNDVMQWARRNGHPEFKWSACLICPFRLREYDTARTIRDDYPESWQNIIQLDAKIRDMRRFGLKRRHYFNADYLPMAEFVEREKPDSDQMSLFDCDGGSCGL